MLCNLFCLDIRYICCINAIAIAIAIVARDA